MGNPQDENERKWRPGRKSARAASEADLR